MMDKIKTEKRKKAISTIRKYSCCFLVCSVFIIVSLWLNGKTNINSSSDGLSQHYRAMLYYSRYLKNVFGNLFEKHTLILPNVDLSIGEGGDILSALHYHGVGDPLVFLSVLIPDRYIYIYFLVNTFIRIYLAGLFFILLCLYMGKENEYAITGGALAYSFCFVVLANITHHVYFITPMLCLPLIILGLEKILNDEKPFLFVFSVFLGGICGIYFLYMEAVATIVYTIIRLITRYKKDYRTAIGKLFLIAVHAILGAAMAAIILFPMANTYISDSRMGIDNETSVLYPRFFYERLLTIFVSNDSPYDLSLGYASPVLLTLALSLKHYKKHKCLTLINIIGLLFVCIPYAGKVFNGFSFVSQRWSFALALPMSYSFVEEWEEIEKNKKFVSFVWLFLLALTFYSAWSRTERVLVPIAFCLVFGLVAFFDSVAEAKKHRILQMAQIVLVMINICYIENYHLSSRGGNAYSELLSLDDVGSINETSEAYVMKQYYFDEKPEDLFYRYSGTKLTNNTAMMFGINSTNYYWSITNPSDQAFRMDLGMLDGISWQIHGYDNRAELESLANVKYLIVKNDYEGLLPYGFDLDRQFTDYKVYVNRYCLPFGYTYDEAYSYEDWNAMNGLQRQKAMMYGVFIESEDTDGIVQKYTEDLDFEVICDENISFDGNTVTVSEKNASLTLKVKGKPEKESYLILSGLNFEDIYGEIEDDHTSSVLRVEASNGSAAVLPYLTKSHHYYFGKSDYVAYLGYDDVIDEIKISFSLIGSYTFKDLRVCVTDMSDYEERIDSLSEEYLENIVFEPNQIKGEITLKKDKYLLLSIPYSKGWTAYVDGDRCEVLKANRRYLALNLGAGSHNIELVYQTPGLKIGAMISGISFVFFFVYLYINRKKK